MPKPSKKVVEVKRVKNPFGPGKRYCYEFTCNCGKGHHLLGGPTYITPQMPATVVTCKCHRKIQPVLEPNYIEQIMAAAGVA
jgi:hypothetical protein